MDENIALRMKFRRLLLSDHGKNFREDVLHQSVLDQFSQCLAGTDTFSEDAGEFVLDPLNTDFG